MGVFIFNEWLWSDIGGENERDGPRQIEAALFLGAFINSDHQFLVITGSKFEAKAFQAIKSLDPKTRLLAVRFLKLMYNSDRCRLYRANELPSLPPNLLDTVKDPDRYLVRALLADGESILVTTDRKLQMALSGGGLVDRWIAREALLKSFGG